WRARRRAASAGARWEAAQAWRLIGTALARAGRARGAARAFGRAQTGLAEMGELLERRVTAAWLRVLASPSAAGPHGSPGAEDLGRGSGARALRFWLEHPLLGPYAREARFSDAQASQVERGARPVPSASNLPGATRSTPHPIWGSIGFVSRSRAVHQVLHLVETYAPSPLPALILGESGTGKDLIAQGVHALSGQPGRYVAVNCAAARKDLFAVELFGARRGAYTGATENRDGLAVAAEGGTLFFDEIADLELEAQGFLLRFLDSGEVRPIGATRSRQVATRIVAATCADLAALVAEGRFRPDLYGRLAGLVVRMPPLRERLEDLAPIIGAIWAREGGVGESEEIFDERVLAALREWHWPGNVRELRHAVQRGMLYARTHGEAAAGEQLIAWVAALSHGAAAPGTPPPPAAVPAPSRRRRGDWDAGELTEVLERAGGRVAEAAKILGLSRSHAYRLYRQLQSDGEANTAGEEPRAGRQV
ncbi:MAG: sigma-54-dependent Fis family transcriptional regulator, partial [Candidatus Eisenbacteria sp.]|nr:sigma-54-dependent Fis family transcriptional regulator [Candidatus Eisenbacteria bacterium]